MIENRSMYREGEKRDERRKDRESKERRRGRGVVKGR